MNVYIVAILATISLQANADAFTDIAGYDEVSIADESMDQSAIDDISDAVGTDDEVPQQPSELRRMPSSDEQRWSNATPEPEYDSGLSQMANKFGKKKIKKMKKGKMKMAKNSKGKKKNRAKKRTLARN